MQLVSFYLAFPRRHDFMQARNALPAMLLQQFAWTEANAPRRRAARLAALNPPACSIPPPRQPSAAAAPAPVCLTLAASRRMHVTATSPLFCFETAIKLFFWSVVVYAYQEEAPGSEGASLDTMPAPIHELLGEMDAAMRLYGLRKRRLFYDHACGTKALVAWSDSVVLLSFRGSAEVANFVQDVNVRPNPTLV